MATKKPVPVPKKRKPKDMTDYDLRGIRNDITEQDRRILAAEQRLTAIEGTVSTLARQHWLPSASEITHAPVSLDVSAVTDAPASSESKEVQS